LKSFFKPRFVCRQEADVKYVENSGIEFEMDGEKLTWNGPQRIHVWMETVLDEIRHPVGSEKPSADYLDDQEA